MQLVYFMKYNVVNIAQSHDKYSIYKNILNTWWKLYDRIEQIFNWHIFALPSIMFVVMHVVSQCAIFLRWHNLTVLVSSELSHSMR